MIVIPDADLDQATDALMGAAYLETHVISGVLRLDQLQRGHESGA